MEIGSEILKKKHLKDDHNVLSPDGLFDTGFWPSTLLPFKNSIISELQHALAADSTMYILHCLSMLILDKKNELILCTGKMLFLEIPQKK
jgi:hypothetical protein